MKQQYGRDMRRPEPGTGLRFVRAVPGAAFRQPTQPRQN
jgi:hypothetical protein